MKVQYMIVQWFISLLVCVCHEALAHYSTRQIRAYQRLSQSRFRKSFGLQVKKHLQRHEKALKDRKRMKAP